MDLHKTLRISIPTDNDGFIGFACNEESCRQYFKVYEKDCSEALHCPYCGTQSIRNSLLTSDQHDYAREVAVEEARVLAIEEIQRQLQRGLRGSKNIKFKPGRPPIAKRIEPRYVEREVDTEFQCEQCSTRFQVYGIFGFCPGCSQENLQLYDANWANIKRELDVASDRNRQLRHAYSDLISTFEIFCKRKAKSITQGKGKFQDLFDTRKFFKKHINVDILADIHDEDLLALRRVFQKRHVCIHAGGEITERYVKKVPEDNSLLGTQVVLTVEELDTAATAIRLALSSLIKALERPGARNKPFGGSGQFFD